jgi:hypothetical protein
LAEGLPLTTLTEVAPGNLDGNRRSNDKKISKFVRGASDDAGDFFPIPGVRAAS